MLYIENLIGPDTVNTIPPKTMDAFRDHGHVAPTLGVGLDEAKAVLAAAERLGLDLDGVTDRLVEDGVKQFADAADKLYAAVAKKRAAALGERQNGQSVRLSADLTEAVEAARETARADGWARRLWAGDKPNLWTGGDEAQWMGWLGAAEGKTIDLAALEAFQSEVADAGFIHAVVLGMGGSSLGPDVLAETFGSRAGKAIPSSWCSIPPTRRRSPAWKPRSIRRGPCASSPPSPARRWSPISSPPISTRPSSGPWAQTPPAAISSPSPTRARRWKKTATAEGYRRTFLGDPTIGGRYSVLSNFGMVPAAVMGLDVRAFMASAAIMTHACAASAPPEANPGVELGLVLGAAAKVGRDKLTFIVSNGLSDLAAWLEQLIAESTGKNGKGIIPIATEPMGKPETYGRDRVFAYIRVDGDDVNHDTHVRALEEAGHPVVRITLADRDTIGQEFVRWEVATAIAGAVIGINPFDQPDVEASKIKTRALTDAYEKTGAWVPDRATAEADGLAVFADAANLEALTKAGATVSLDALLGAHVKRANGGDYLALLAYIDRSHEHVEALQKLRGKLREHTHAATALGFGPRFLHSTGQAYKGGPNSGVFIEITHDAARDLAVPGRKFSFGLVEQAQAKGDLGVLEERGRRVLRVNLGADVGAGLTRLADAIDRSLI